MCSHTPGEPWYSYVFRQLCEKTQFILAISGYVALWWFSSKFEDHQNKLLSVIHESHVYQDAQTRAMQELTILIRDINGHKRN